MRRQISCSTHSTLAVSHMKKLVEAHSPTDSEVTQQYVVNMYVNSVHSFFCEDEIQILYSIPPAIYNAT